MPKGYTSEVAASITAFASEDMSFHDAAVAYERHLKNTLTLWSAASKAKGEHTIKEAEETASYSSKVGDVLRGIMFLRWPEAMAEWIKGL